MLMTPWGEHLDENCILTEYPRPQMRRDSYLNLNGRWEYAITDSDELPRRWDGTILVPFSPESALSGVGRSLQPGQTLWYRREVILPYQLLKCKLRSHRMLRAIALTWPGGTGKLDGQLEIADGDDISHDDPKEAERCTTRGSTTRRRSRFS